MTTDSAIWVLYSRLIDNSTDARREDSRQVIESLDRLTKWREDVAGDDLTAEWERIISRLADALPGVPVQEIVHRVMTEHSA
jgi:hypothetical protein